MTGNIAAEIEAGALLFTSIATADIDVAIERIDLSDWLFELPSAEYEYCSADHIACGTTLSPEGRRMSINVEAIGNDVLVQHYIEEATSPSACRVVSISDLFHRPRKRRYNSRHSNFLRVRQLWGAASIIWPMSKQARNSATLATNDQTAAF